jgi:hypothetical protein
MITRHPFASASLALILFVLSISPVRADEDVYQKVASATTLIYKGPGTFFAGTGFLVDAGERLVVTARHVVENVQGGLAPNISVVFAQAKDGEIITDAAHYRNNYPILALPGKVVYDSVRRDMAVIQLDKLPSKIKPLKLASRDARPGQTVHIVGNSSEPFGGVFSYCQGYVRNAFQWGQIGARVIATQAPTNKGDSGGPTVNSRGEVVGFAFMSTTGNTNPKGIFHDLQVTGLSMCVSEINQALQELRDRRLSRAGPNDAARGTASLQGSPRAAVHFVWMEKGMLYRILVKAEDFVPEVRVDNIVPPTFASGKEFQHLFTPAETKQYRLQVGNVPGRDVGQGSLPYTLSVDQITFEPETALKDPVLKTNEHEREFEAGKVYDIIVKSKAFEPDVRIIDGVRIVATQMNYGVRANAGTTQRFFEAVGLSSKELVTNLRFVPAKTGKHRILITVSPFSPPRAKMVDSKPLDYTVNISEQKVYLSLNDQLTGDDPLYPQAGAYKVHGVKLEAGKSYQIDLTTNAFDSHVVLEDPGCRPVMQGFDVDAFSSRLIFRATRTATYRVVASARQPGLRGPYAVTVTETAPMSGTR